MPPRSTPKTKARRHRRPPGPPRPAPALLVMRVHSRVSGTRSLPLRCNAWGPPEGGGEGGETTQQQRLRTELPRCGPVFLILDRRRSPQRVLDSTGVCRPWFTSPPMICRRLRLSATAWPAEDDDNPGHGAPPHSGHCPCSPVPGSAPAHHNCIVAEFVPLSPEHSYSSMPTAYSSMPTAHMQHTYTHNRLLVHRNFSTRPIMPPQIHLSDLCDSTCQPYPIIAGKYVPQITHPSGIWSGIGKCE